jgi:hypothetical protein
MSQLVLGVGLGLCTTFLSALGLVCKKRAHLDPAHAGKRSCRKPAWLLGLACLAASALASLGVSYLLGQQLASCMAAVTIVWTLLLRRALLREALSRLDGAVAALLVAGVLTVLLAAPAAPAAAAPRPADPRLLLAAALSAPAAQGAVGAGGAAAALLSLGAHAPCARARLPRPARPPLLLLLAALYSAATGVCSKALGAHLAFAAAGSARAAFAAPTLWLALGGLLASVAAQLWHLNAALKCAPAALVLPAYQALFVLAGVGAGALVWGEGAARSPAAAGGLAAGLLCMLAGLFVLLAGHAGGAGEAGGAAAAPAAAAASGTALVVGAAPPAPRAARKRAASLPLCRAAAPAGAASAVSADF